MTALLRVELTRLRWRRAVLLLLLAAVAIPAVVLASTAYGTRPFGAEEQRWAEQQVARESRQPYVQRELRRCLERPGRYGLGDAEDVQAACEEQVLPQPEWYLSRQPLDLVQEREGGSGVAVAVVLAALMLLAGTTFAGHDWNSGSMSNQLLFEPRRARVWAAKAAVVLVGAAAFAGLVLAAYWTGLWAVATARDLDLPDGAVSGGYGQALRGALLAGAAGLGGYALTMLFRSTVGTLGVMFAVAAAGTTLLAVLGVPEHHWLLPHNNVAAVLLDGVELTRWDLPGCQDGGPGTECLVRIGTGQGAGYLGAVVVAAAAASLWSFRRRDVP